MDFIVYLCIQSGTTHNAYGRFAIYFVCLVPHIHLTQACVLKPRKGFLAFLPTGMSLYLGMVLAFSQIINDYAFFVAILPFGLVFVLYQMRKLG